MRDLNELNKYRVQSKGFPLPQTSTSGAFYVPAGKRMFMVIASVDHDPVHGPMEHVSVSHRNEKIIPTWEEMCEIKDLFFLPEEECVQLHPKHSEYVNMRKNCLHIWRPVNGIIFAK